MYSFAARMKRSGGGQVGRRRRRRSRAGPLVGAAGMLDEDGAAAGRATGLRRRSSVSPIIHERRGRCPARRPRRAASRARACGSRTAPVSSGTMPVGVVEAELEVVEARALARRAARARAPGSPAAPSTRHVPLAAAGWLETPTSSQPASARRRSAAAAPGDQRARPRRRSGDSGWPLTGSGTSSLIDAVAVDEDRPGAAHAERPAASDSQCPGCAASSGCETSACQTTAWKDSTSGVFRSAGVVDDRPRRRRARPASRPGEPTTP